VAVIVGFTAAYFTLTPRPVIAEFGRYLFPAIGPVALFVVGALHAFAAGDGCRSSAPCCSSR